MGGGLGTPGALASAFAAGAAYVVTGSVNQHGQVRAIGGVNEKIEGFFEICRVTEVTTQGSSTD